MSDADLWSPAAEAPSHPVTAIDGAEVGEGVRLAVELGPSNHVGARYFRGFLDSADLGRTFEPVFVALHHAGRYAARHWVDVIDTYGRVPVAGGEVEVPEGIDAAIVTLLAGLVPPGGHLMMEYDSEYRRPTARALAQRVPPVATPLGGLMFAAGCGVAFRDWYTPEGGREGPRKLQGFRALDREHQILRAGQMLEELDHFLAHSADLDWDLQLKCRPLAENTVTALRSGLGVLPPSFGTPGG